MLFICLKFHQEVVHVPPTITQFNLSTHYFPISTSIEIEMLDFTSTVEDISPSLEVPLLKIISVHGSDM